MKKVAEILLIILIPEIIIFTIIAVWNPDKLMNPFDKKTIKLTEKVDMPVDHSKFAVLQKDFETAEQVTEACLMCHNNVAQQLMMNEHWTWTKIDTIPGKGGVSIGKRNIINNFCVGVNSNEKLCSMCHAGLGYDNKEFGFDQSNKMDCLVCHDNTGTFKKGKIGKTSKIGSGYPADGVDLKAVALNVGSPKKENCGACHYVGGGGNNVKHGDLEKALNNCTVDIDVHMASNGNNMTCIECHKTNNHNIPGNLPMISASPSNSFSCSECHTDRPHSSKLLNDHYNQVACQTCHIPKYAKVSHTKIYWDWSTTGTMDSVGKYLATERIISEDTLEKYDSKHGTGIYVKNAIPEYAWFNGYTDHHFIEDTINSDTLYLNTLLGSYEDNINPYDSKNPSKIYPVKVMRGKQIYDTENKKIIQPKLIGAKGSGAYWADYDWNKSATIGMNYLGLPYSGKYDFIYTESFWPLHHEVSPASEAE